jgi:KDO2-lipid IV(A) lauroyltransferase
VKHRFKHYIEYLTFRLSIGIFRFLPYKVVLWKLKCLFFIWGYLFGIRKRVVVSQLKNVFPEKSADEIRKLTKTIYTELSISVAEIFIFDDRYFDGKVELVGIENVNTALEYGRGVLLVSAHFSNWELGAKYTAREFGQVVGVAKSQHNKLFNDYINQQRASSGLTIVEMKNAVKHIVSAVKKNQIVALLVDQYAGKHGVEMDFLGLKTKSYTSVAQLAIKLGSPVIVCFDFRKDGKHQIIYSEPCFFNDLTNSIENVIKVTAEINSDIEQKIRDFPHLWFWVHKKFRF